MRKNGGMRVVGIHLGEHQTLAIRVPRPAGRPPASGPVSVAVPASAPLDHVMEVADAPDTMVVVAVGTGLDDIIERAPTQLGRVTAVRVSPNPAAIRRPMQGWPAALRDAIDAGTLHLRGGTDLSGAATIDIRQLDQALRTADERHADAFSISATGAMIDARVEVSGAEYLLRHGGGRPVVVSHERGAVRFFEREAATILNAALLKPAARLFTDIESSMADIVPAAQQFFLLADGSRGSREEARAHPVRMVGADPAAVAQGAAAYAGLRDAVVMLHDGASLRLFILDDGCLHAEFYRKLPGGPLPRFTQRHAVSHELSVESWLGEQRSGMWGDARTQDARAIVIVRGDGVPDERWEQDLETVRARAPGLRVIDSVPELPAWGAAAALPQAETMKLALPGTSLETARERLRAVVQGRVVSSVPDEVELVTLTDQVAPLSFLPTGPVLFRIHVAGRA